MSGSGDSGSSLARAGVFLLGSLLGAAVAGAGVYSSLYSRKSIRSQGPSVAYVDGPHDDNRDDLPDVFPVFETRRSSLHTNSGSAQDTPPRVARHRRQSSEGLHDDRETRPRERMGRRGGHRHNSGETNRERSERRGGSTNARDSRDPADTTTDESDAEDKDARDGNPARSKSRNGSTATTRREILRDDGHDASPKPGNFDHSVKPPRPPPLSPSRPSIDQSGVPRNLPGSRATKVSGRAWTPRAHGAARGGEDQSEFTETDADNDGNDFITDVVVLSSPRPQASPEGEGASTRGLGSGSGDPETSATADAQAPSPLSRSASLDPMQRDREKVFTASLSPKRPSGETIRSGVSGEGLLANSPGGAPGADAKSASRVLAYVGLETPGSHVGRLAEKALRGVDDPSLGLAPSSTGSAEASDPRAAGDPNHSPGVDQTNGVTSATARALSDSFQETISTQPEISFSRKSSLGALAEQPVTYEYGRVLAPDDELTSECEEVCLMLEHCMALRDEYLFVSETEIDPNKGTPCVTGKIEITPNELLPKKGKHAFEMIAGVMHVYEETDDENEFSKGDSDGTASASSTKTKKLVFAPPATATQFFHDMHAVLRVHSYGPSKSFCHKRLNLTEQKFSLHVMLNADREFHEQKTAPHRDFYNVRKVDTHVHHSACMNQKHLLRFIKHKLKSEWHEQVIYRDGKFLNLREVFESINLSGYDLNVDTLDMRSDAKVFHRFDRFNLKYNPCGQSRLREVFIKQDNLIRGRFLAEITKEVIHDLDANKYQMAEYRISVYGRRLAEWDTLSSWVLNNRVFSKNVVWLIQIPRLYNVYKSQGTMGNFQQMLDNIFQPLFEVTNDPASHPALHHFLQLVVGFDMVDDESKPERRPSKHMRTPEEWDVSHNPAFSYYAYYVYANLFTLNNLREAKGLNVITFRPHAGEAGDLDHLACAFLLTKNIAHGINLRKSPVLQYLFYLAEIGLNMSPLSNNSLFLDYHRNPFPVFFARGLRVALSTDDPLQIHMTKEPLVEEYSVAAQVWKMSAADLCEVARNSVLNSDFPHRDKQHWVGKDYWEPGPVGNDIKKTNVPNVRVQFRHDVLEAEKALIRAGVKQATAKGRVLHVS